MTPQEHFDPIKPDTETAYQSESQLQANAGLNQNEALEEIKHTPGPWRQAGACIYRESQPIGRVYSVSAEDEGSTLANACLMAAAPDLLEALKSVRATFGDSQSHAGEGFEMTPTAFTRLESAYESHCARLYGEYLDQLDENEARADIEQAFWDALNFNDIGSALADDSAIDGAAFVRAVQKGDSEKVLDLLQRAVQVYIEQCAQQEYKRRLREAEERESELCDE